MTIINQLKNIKQHHRHSPALMTHLVSGYPDLQTSELLIEILAEYSDFIEIQIPFSDPMADGPVIMAANQKALAKGIKVKDSFTLMNKMSKKVKIPLLFMCYYNMVFNYGVEKFCADAKKAGAAGLIVPDIPPEEGEEYLAACRKNNLPHIFVVAPTSTEKRLKLIKKHADGFVYCMARTGVTGTKTDFNQKLTEYLNRVRKFIKLPLAVGFGIKNKEQINSLKKQAEIAVIGSAVLEEIGNLTGLKAIKKVETFLKKLKIQNSNLYLSDALVGVRLSVEQN